MSELAERIFTLLRERKIEQKELARLVGTTDKTVSAWKNGRSQSYTKYLPQIAEVLDTSVEHLLTGEGKKPAPASAPDFWVKFNSLSPEGQKEVIAFIEFKRGQESQS